MRSGKITSMKLVVGLGNPGEKYRNNRHNVGHMVIDKLSQTLNKSQILIFKSKNYMNDSGNFVLKLTKDYVLSTRYLYVIHDDLDIPLGSYKIQLGKGPKEHKGLISIYESLGTRDFWHIRIGVDNRDPKNRINGEKYVLEDFAGEEVEKVEEVVKKVVEDLCNRLEK